MELIDIINVKNEEVHFKQKECDIKIMKMEASTRGSCSYGVANSDSLLKMFKIMNIKVTNERYSEEDLMKLVVKIEKILKTKNHLETDNKFLRDKLDEADKDFFKVKQRLKTVEGSLSTGSQEVNPYGNNDNDDDEEDIEINIVDDSDKFEKTSNMSGLSMHPAMSKTFSLGSKISSQKAVPKLDFSTLKHNKEFKDWYKYAIKLEKSIKTLRSKIKTIEIDMDDCRHKNIQLRKQNTNLYILNKKLVSNTKLLKKKIIELKEKYNKRVKRAQKFGVDALEMTIPRFDTDVTYDYTKDDLAKDYIDDFNSNDSYDPDKLKNGVIAYKRFDKSKTVTLDSNEGKDRLNTEYILEQNDYYDLDELTSGKNTNKSKKSSLRKDTSPLSKYIDQQKSESPKKETREDPFGLKKPDISYKKKGLITKVNINDDGRDMLAGRKRLMKRTKLNKVLGSSKKL